MRSKSAFAGIAHAFIWFGLLSCARAFAQDCNYNNRQDSEDIIRGWSRDCNRSGIPDECEVVPPLAYSHTVDVLEAKRPISLAAGDFDGDSDPDLVTANWNSDNVSLVLNDGMGVLNVSSAVAVDAGPRQLRAGDLDADGDLDVAVACTDANSIVLLTNDGLAQLSRAATLEEHSEPLELLLFSVDAQGPPDIAVHHAPGNGVSLWRNMGQMSFAALPDAPQDSQAQGIVSADLDQDGNADLLVARRQGGTPGAPSDNPSRITLLRGAGTGSFTTGPSFARASALGPFWAGDLDGDLQTDLLSGFQVLWNNSGKLSAGPVASWGITPLDVAVMDLDGDGDRDLAYCGSGGVSPIENKGNRILSPWPRPTLPWGECPSIVAADFDGNGIPDLALVNSGSCCEYRNGEVSVLFGEGLGAFKIGPQLRLEFKSTSVTRGDWDLDGDLDIALSSEEQGRLAICLNDGAGRFGAASLISTGGRPGWINAGDTDGDGAPDLIVPDEPGSKISLLRNDGEGRFFAPLEMATSFHPLSTALWDDQGDGDLDLLYTSSLDFRLVVLRNDGSGGFSESLKEPRQQRPRHVVLREFNGDGNPEFVLAQSSEATVLRLTDTRGFEDIDSVPFGAIFHFDLADLDLDGRTDLLAFSFSPALYILRRLDEGFSRRVVAYSANSQMGMVLCSGDFNSDGAPDLVTARSSLEVAAVFTFAGAAISTDADGNGMPDECDLKEIDCNQNGFLDTQDVQSGSSLDCNGNGIPDECDIRPSLAFAPPVDFRSGSTPYGIASGDLNNDGYADISTAAPNSNRVSAFISDRGFSLKPIRNYPIVTNVPGTFGSSKPRGLAMADLDGDGDLDLASANEGTFSSSDSRGSVSVLSNRGDGTFTILPYIPVGPGPLSIAAADLDGDGSMDLATANNLDGTLSLLFGASQGTFTAGPTLPTGGSTVTAVIASDLNGDGIPDLAAALSSDDQVAVLRNDGQGSFASSTLYAAGKKPIAFVATDMDGDARTDLAVASASSGTISILRAEPDGTLQRHENVFQQPACISLAAADLDGNGRIDIAAATTETSSTWIQLNHGLDHAFEVHELRAGILPFSVTVGDMDGAGGPDVIVGIGEGETTADDGIAVLLNFSTSSRDCDGNRAPDECDIAGGALEDGNSDGIADLCLSALRFGKVAPPDTEQFHRGDANGDGNVDLGDPIAIIHSLFLSLSPLECLDAADTDNSGLIDITDPIFLLQFLFLRGFAPPSPGPSPLKCGPDPEPEGAPGRLGCSTQGKC